MAKPLIKIADKQFAHNPTSSFGAGDLLIEPTNFSWYRGDENINDIVVITESCFDQVDNFKEKIKIALLLEPPSIDRRGYDFVAQNEHKFDYILTHQKDLLNKSYKYKFYVFGGCWIKPEDRKLHIKTKNVSIISSAKNTTEGHKLRHDIIKFCGSMIDGVYGRGYTPIDNKIEALKDYKYSIIIENEKSDYWVTEKYFDAVMCGCIPIYWGSPHIKNFQNIGGIHMVTNLTDLMHVLALIQKQPEQEREIYGKMYDCLVDNFEKSKQYLIPEDYIYKNFFKPTLNL